MDLEQARWRKSSFTGEFECVEVAYIPGTVAVRDSKDPSGGTILLPEPAWHHLLNF